MANNDFAVCAGRSPSAPAPDLIGERAAEETTIGPICAPFERAAATTNSVGSSRDATEPSHRPPPSRARDGTQSIVGSEAPRSQSTLGLVSSHVGGRARACAAIRISGRAIFNRIGHEWRESSAKLAPTERKRKLASPQTSSRTCFSPSEIWLPDFPLVQICLGFTIL